MIPNWLTIVLAVGSISATLIAPVIPLYIAQRAAKQPSIKPDENHSQKRISRIGLLLRNVLSSLWFTPSVSILYGSLGLIHDLHRTTLVTSHLVVAINLDMLQIAYGVGVFFLLYVLSMIRTNVALQHRIAEKLFAPGARPIPN